MLPQELWKLVWGSHSMRSFHHILVLQDTVTISIYGVKNFISRSLYMARNKKATEERRESLELWGGNWPGSELLLL